MAVAGTVVTAPMGARHIVQSVSAVVRAAGRRLWGWLARWVPWLRRRPITREIKQAQETWSALAPTLASVDLSWDEEAPPQAQIQRLREQIADVLGEVNRVSQHREADLARVRERLERLVAELRGRLDELERRFAAAERQAALIDARGLPLIGFGILLTGIPEELACFAPLGWSLCVIAVVATALLLVFRRPSP
jgi:septal ring factor EnvC (AmiA/AmiB activator)